MGQQSTNPLDLAALGRLAELILHACRAVYLRRCAAAAAAAAPPSTTCRLRLRRTACLPTPPTLCSRRLGLGLGLGHRHAACLPTQLTVSTRRLVLWLVLRLGLGLGLGLGHRHTACLPAPLTMSTRRLVLWLVLRLRLGLGLGLRLRLRLGLRDRSRHTAAWRRVPPPPVRSTRLGATAPRAAPPPRHSPTYRKTRHHSRRRSAWLPQRTLHRTLHRSSLLHHHQGALTSSPSDSRTGGAKTTLISILVCEEHQRLSGLACVHPISSWDQEFLGSVDDLAPTLFPVPYGQSRFTRYFVLQISQISPSY